MTASEIDDDFHDAAADEVVDEPPEGEIAVVQQHLAGECEHQHVTDQPVGHLQLGRHLGILLTSRRRRLDARSAAKGPGCAVLFVLGLLAIAVVVVTGLR